MKNTRIWESKFRYWIQSSQVVSMDNRPIQMAYKTFDTQAIWRNISLFSDPQVACIKCWEFYVNENLPKYRTTWNGFDNKIQNTSEIRMIRDIKYDRLEVHGQVVSHYVYKPLLTYSYLLGGTFHFHIPHQRPMKNLADSSRIPLLVATLCVVYHWSDSQLFHTPTSK